MNGMRGDLRPLGSSLTERLPMNRRVMAAEMTRRTEVRNRNPPPHVVGYGSRAQGATTVRGDFSMNLTKEFLTQSRQDAKKRSPSSFASLRLCVSLPSDSQWFRVPMRTKIRSAAMV